jgi:hypothetical protein
MPGISLKFLVLMRKFPWVIVQKRKGKILQGTGAAHCGKKEAKH